FRAADQRGGKLIAPVIDRVVPSSVAPGKTPPPELKLLGERLGKGSIVRINGQDRSPGSVSEEEITVRPAPEDVKSRAQIKITAVNPDGGASPAVTFHVTTLAITTPAGPIDAKIGSDLSAALDASGGKAPYKWAIEGPEWLRINASALQGRPLSVGTEKVTVKVTDYATATLSNGYD